MFVFLLILLELTPFVQVLIPSAQVFSQCEKIPIHIQLSGISSHAKFLAPKVSLIRQITVEIRGERASRMLPTGEGKILSIASVSEDVLNWQGKLCVASNMICAGAFTASGVSVRVCIPSYCAVA